MLPKGTLGIFVISPSDGCTHTTSSSRLHASLATLLCILHFEASRCCDRGSQTGLGGRSSSVESLTSVCGSTEKPSVFCVEPLQTSRTWCGLTPIPLMTWLTWSSLLDLCFVAQSKNRTWLRLTLLATMRSTLDPVGHQFVRTKPTCLSTPRGHTCIDLLHLFFTCTNANQAATCTCNTKQRVSPHNVSITHHQGVTIHRSSDGHKSSKEFAAVVYRSRIWLVGWSVPKYGEGILAKW
jgi:hypothetical protein